MLLIFVLCVIGALSGESLGTYNHRHWRRLSYYGAVVLLAFGVSYLLLTDSSYWVMYRIKSNPLLQLLIFPLRIEYVAYLIPSRTSPGGFSAFFLNLEIAHFYQAPVLLTGWVGDGIIIAGFAGILIGLLVTQILLLTK